LFFEKISFFRQRQGQELRRKIRKAHPDFVGSFNHDGRRQSQEE
jgi:hypothetical protein